MMLEIPRPRFIKIAMTAELTKLDQNICLNCGQFAIGSPR